MEQTNQTQSKRPSWVFIHLPVLLYGWFWLGMFLTGFLAPQHRVEELQSSVIQQGWHLSLLACILGIPPLVMYWRRVSKRN